MTTISATSVGKDILVENGNVSAIVHDDEGEVTLIVKKGSRTKVCVDTTGDSIIVFTRPMTRYETGKELDLTMVEAETVRDALPDDEADFLTANHGGQ